MSNFKPKKMKKLVLVLVLIAGNISLISCTSDVSSNNDNLYETISETEGDDGDIEKDPDEEPGDEN
tara:strand:+ start:6057 stop:6254 length:198 start_codon:yes stop_codon:yes gene_type:complete